MKIGDNGYDVSDLCYMSLCFHGNMKELYFCTTTDYHITVYTQHLLLFHCGNSSGLKFDDRIWIVVSCVAKSGKEMEMETVFSWLMISCDSHLQLITHVWGNSGMSLQQFVVNAGVILYSGESLLPTLQHSRVFLL